MANMRGQARLHEIAFSVDQIEGDQKNRALLHLTPASGSSLPLTTNSIFFCSSPSFLYKVLHLEPTKMMVLVVNGPLMPA